MRRWLFRLGIALVTGLLLYGAAAAQNLTHAFVPQRSLEEQIALIQPGIAIHLPSDADGPVPAILLFHGCGGERPMHTSYAELITSAGYAVIIVDSFEPRGIGRFAAMTQVCAALRLLGQERSADVFAALEIARQTDGIDPDRLVLAGWSHGGWTLLEAMRFVSEETRPVALTDGALSFDGVQTIVPIYPYCSFPSRASGRIGPGLPAVVMILSGRDRVAPVGACQRLAANARNAGAVFHDEVWEGLTHAFDDPDTPVLDPRMSYDADAAGRLQSRLIEILQETQG
ncbi:dienelactone hydrolase family protein [Hyphobacterium sp.]|uniref:dienelactone hydrolase family protein n=1 Tax=Hyphobacterium sp. TaxID=2004662 RepID=UPI003BAD38E1